MDGQADNKDQALKVYKEAAGYASVRDALYKGQTGECTDFPGRLAGANGVAQNIALQQRSLILDAQIKPFLDTLKAEAKATARTTNEAKFQVVNDTVEKARTDLSAILTAAGSNLANIDPVTQTWQKVQDKDMQAKNDEITSRLKGIANSRTALTKMLNDALDAQGILDGKDKDGKDTGDAGKDKIMPQLKAIVVDNDAAVAGGIPMTLTVNTNKAYPDFLTAQDANIKKADIKPAGGEASAYSSDAKGLANGTGGADKTPKSYDQLQLKAKTAIELAVTNKDLFTAADGTATSEVPEKGSAPSAPTINSSV